MILLYYDVLSDCYMPDVLSQLAWIIPASTVAGIILPGVLLLVFAKLIQSATVRLINLCICVYACVILRHSFSLPLGKLKATLFDGLYVYIHLLWSQLLC